MQQSALPFMYKAEKNESGLTALGGLPVYRDLIKVAGLRLGRLRSTSGPLLAISIGLTRKGPYRRA